jgi:hypothetical protein
MKISELYCKTENDCTILSQLCLKYNIIPSENYKTTIQKIVLDVGKLLCKDDISYDLAIALLLQSPWNFPLIVDKIQQFTNYQKNNLYSIAVDICGECLYFIPYEDLTPELILKSITTCPRVVMFIPNHVLLPYFDQIIELHNSGYPRDSDFYLKEQKRTICKIAEHFKPEIVANYINKTHSIEYFTQFTIPLVNDKIIIKNILNKNIIDNIKFVKPQIINDFIEKETDIYRISAKLVSIPENFDQINNLSIESKKRLIRTCCNLNPQNINTIFSNNLLLEYAEENSTSFINFLTINIQNQDILVQNYPYFKGYDRIVPSSAQSLINMINVLSKHYNLEQLLTFVNTAIISNYPIDDLVLEKMLNISEETIITYIENDYCVKIIYVLDSIISYNSKKYNQPRPGYYDIINNNYSHADSNTKYENMCKKIFTLGMNACTHYLDKNPHGYEQLPLEIRMHEPFVDKYIENCEPQVSIIPEKFYYKIYTTKAVNRTTKNKCLITLLPPEENEYYYQCENIEDHVYIASAYNEWRLHTHAVLENNMAQCMICFRNTINVAQPLRN